jgi:hypothetical protein
MKYADEEREENARLAARPDAAQLAATLQQKLKQALEREQRLQARIDELENGTRQRT